MELSNRIHERCHGLGFSRLVDGTVVVIVQAVRVSQRTLQDVVAERRGREAIAERPSVEVITVVDIADSA